MIKVANKTISDFPEVTTVNDNDEFILQTAAGTTSKVKKINIGTGAVSSVFGRDGSVIAEAGDYDASQITNAFDKTVDTTTDITEGSNLYYTEDRVSANSSVVANTAKVSFDWDYDYTDLINTPTIPSSLSGLSGDLDDISDGSVYVKSENNFSDTYKGYVDSNNAKVSFPEAPNDGQQYARQSEGWSVVTGGGGSSLEVNVETLTGNKTLVSGTDKPVQILSSSANYTITLDTTGASEGDQFIIKKDDDNAYHLTIDATNLSQSLVIEISGQQTANFVYNGTTWDVLRGAESLTEDNVVIGGGAYSLSRTTSSRNVIVGTNSRIESSGVNDSVVIGSDSRANYDNIVSIGSQCLHGSSTSSTVVGANVDSNTSYQTKIGTGGTGLGVRNTELGFGCDADGQDSTALGRGAKTRFAEQITFGSNNNSYMRNGFIQYHGVFLADTFQEIFLGNKADERFLTLSNSAVVIDGFVTLRDETIDEVKVIKVTAVVKNVSGTVSFVGTPSYTVVGVDSSMGSADAEIALDTVNDGFILNAKGISSSNVTRVTAFFTICEAL